MWMSEAVLALKTRTLLCVTQRPWASTCERRRCADAGLCWKVSSKKKEKTECGIFW
jgi:hypothetical protein